MRVGQVGQFGVAPPTLDPGCIHATHVRVEHREEAAAACTVDQFVDRPRIPEIEVTGVDHGHINLLLPQVAHRQGQHPEDAAGPLEVLGGGELVVEKIDQGRVEGIVGDHAFTELLPRGMAGQQGLVPGVQLHIVGRGASGGRLVDTGEQPLAEHPGDLRRLHGHHRGGIPGDDAGHALGRLLADGQGVVLVHVLAGDLGKELAQLGSLVGKGIGGRGQGDDHGDTRMAAGVAVQGHEEGGQLISAVRPGRLQPGRVLGQLVEHDQHLLPLEDRGEVVVPRRRHGGGDLLDTAVERLPADLEGDLAPQGVGDQLAAHRLVHRDTVSRDTDDLYLAWRLQQGRRDEVRRYLRQLGPPPGQVGTGDEGVGLAAAEGRFQPMDGRCAVVAGYPGKDIADDTSHAVRRVGGLTEKTGCIRVQGMQLGVFLPVERKDLAQGSGEDLRVEGPRDDVLSWCTSSQNPHAVPPGYWFFAKR